MVIGERKRPEIERLKKRKITTTETRKK